MNKNELERIYEEHAACAASLFRRFTSCESDTRDLLQDWLIKIAKNVDSMEAVENERSYLLRIAYRTAVDWSRKSATRRKYNQSFAEESAGSEFKGETDPDREVLRISLEQSLVTLPPEQQMVVQLKLWDSMSFAEIGEILNISPNTASSRYRYGISRLRENLQPIYEELCN